MTSFLLFYLVGMGRSSGGMGPKSKPGYSKKLQKLRKEFNEYCDVGDDKFMICHQHH